MLNKKRIIRKFQGIVISDKMDKTIVVRVDRVKVDSKYGKRYKTSRKYHVHDNDNKYHIGESVAFFETRPLSKTKRWSVQARSTNN